MKGGSRIADIWSTDTVLEVLLYELKKPHLCLRSGTLPASSLGHRALDR